MRFVYVSMMAMIAAPAFADGRLDRTDSRIMHIEYIAGQEKDIQSNRNILKDLTAKSENLAVVITKLETFISELTTTHGKLTKELTSKREKLEGLVTKAKNLKMNLDALIRNRTDIEAKLRAAEYDLRSTKIKKNIEIRSADLARAAAKSQFERTRDQQWTIWVYDSPNYRGDSRSWTWQPHRGGLSVSNLSGAGWNDRIDSIKVKRTR